jgi:hypothetical protein
VHANERRAAPHEVAHHRYQLERAAGPACLRDKGVAVAVDHVARTARQQHRRVVAAGRSGREALIELDT